MLIILIGKTASGKDTILNNLVSEHGFEKIITYTTRPRRKGEEQDVTYHFISEEEFQQKVENEFFLEYKTYDTVDGTWHYGSSAEDYEKAENESIIILTPDGYRDFLDKFPYKIHKSLYIYANNQTIRKRLINRGDNKLEAERRLSHDNECFKGVENIVNKIVYNNHNNKLDDVIKMVLEYAED